MVLFILLLKNYNQTDTTNQVGVKSINQNITDNDGVQVSVNH